MIPAAPPPPAAHLCWWRLSLRPDALQRAFWLERAARLRSFDLAVAWFQIAVIGALLFSFAAQPGMTRLKCLRIFSPQAAVALPWLVAMLAAPQWYLRHRLAVVGFVRLFTCVTALQTTNAMRHMIYTAYVFDSPLKTHLAKYLSVCSPPQMLIEGIALALPFPLQVLATFLKASFQLLGMQSQVYLQFAARQDYERMAAALNFTWASLISPSAPLLASPVHERLQGRSTEVFLSLMLLFSTASAAVCFVIWLVTLVDIRSWVRDKIDQGGGGGGNSSSGGSGGSGGGGSSGGSGSGSGGSQDLVRFGDGAAVPKAQLEALLLDQQPRLLRHGGVTRVLMQTTTVVMLCQAALAASQLFVHHLAPRAAPDWLLDIYFPRLR